MDGLKAMQDVIRMLRQEGEVCSLQLTSEEKRAMTRLVRFGEAKSEEKTCGHLKCRHYRSTT